MDEPKLKRYILIGLIVFVNAIFIIFTVVSVIKSVNRIESGQVSVSHTEDNSEANAGDLTEAQGEEQVVEEEGGDDIGEGLSVGSIFSKIAKLKDHIDTQNLITCLLLLIGTNLAILSILIFRKIK